MKIGVRERIRRCREQGVRLRFSGRTRRQSCPLIMSSLILALLAIENPLARATTEMVPLDRLGVEDVILLPTVSSQYVVNFTWPHTWKHSGDSKVDISFQHASQLLPDRSWLEVILNNRTIKRVPLTHDNIDNTVMSLSLPSGLIQDFNMLAFRVQQHYAIHCEDPLDKSLWTQILPATRLAFNYDVAAPFVDLKDYPYPLIDTLAYQPSRLRYVLSSQASTESLQAMALLNVNLAQQAGKHEMRTRAVFQGSSGPDEEHALYVGTGDELARTGNIPALSNEYVLQGGRWRSRRQGGDLPDDQGLILFARAPGSSRHAALIVTGNSPRAVLKAARYLTTAPRVDGLAGQAIVTPSNWLPPDTRTARAPRFVENETRTFHELDFSTEEVHKINAPPIVYKIPIVTRFRQADGSRLWLDLSYSYGPGLNPTFSSLEIRMNNISIGNIPLTNPNGESLAQASLPISGELIRPKNELVAQFHMMPDKYGWCVDNYVDRAWGKIMDDSRLRVDGRPTGRLPDTSLLGAAMFPYSREDNLEHLQIVLPSNPDAALLDALLAFTTRLGRTTFADTDLRLSLNQDGRIEKNQDAVVFRHAKDVLTLPDGSRLVFLPDGRSRRLTLADPVGGEIVGELADSPGSAYLEQYALGGERIASVITAQDASAFRGLALLFESDKAFERWNDAAFINQITPLDVQPPIRSVDAVRYHREGDATQKGGWQQWLLSLWSRFLQWPGNLWHWLKGLWPRH